MAKIVLQVNETEKYSLYSMPGADSAIGKKARQDVLGTLVIDEIADGLDLVARMLFLAYNGIAGFPKLEGPMMILHDNFGDACSDTEACIGDFVFSANTVQSSLQIIVENLYGNQMELALSQCAEIVQMGEELREKADLMVQSYKTLSADATRIAASVATEGADQFILAKKIEADMVELKKETAHAESLNESYETILREKKDARDKIIAKLEKVENQAIKMSFLSAIMDPISQGVGAFCAVYSGGALTSSIKALDKSINVGGSEGGDKADPGQIDKLQSDLASARANKAVKEEKLKDLREELKDLEKQLKDKKKDGKDKDVKREGDSGAEVEDSPDEYSKKASSKDTAESAVENEKENYESSDDDFKELNDAIKDKKSEISKIETEIKSIDSTIAKVGAAHAAAVAAEEAKKNIQKVKADLFSLVEQYNKSVDAYEAKIDEIQDNKAKQLALLKGMAVQMQNKKVEKHDVDFARAALLVAEEALKKVSIALKKLKDFWMKMETQSKQLANSQALKLVVNQYGKMSPEMVNKAMESNLVFQGGMVKLYCTWNAIENICSDLAGKASVAKDQVRKDFLVTLPIEKRRALAIRLSKELSGTLDSQLKQLTANSEELKSQNQSDRIVA